MKRRLLILTQDEQRAEAVDAEAMNGVEEAPEEGEVDATAPSMPKVHVRGVDKLNTYDIEQWAEEYYPRDLFKKVQWIDDTSANLVYDTEAAAAEALAALSAEQAEEPLQLRLAKGSSKHPDADLRIRQAIIADIKAPRAKDRSKFYLFNKEWDPDNPDNIRPDNRKRRFVEEDRRDRKYRRRDYGERSQSDEKRHFHESMYDDDPKPVAELRRGSSYSSGSEYGRRRVRYDEDLMTNNEKGRLRDRSASPVQDGDGRYGFDEVQPRRRTARARSPTPPRTRSGQNNRGARDNLRKELFPAKGASTALSNGHTNGSSQDSYSVRPSTPNSSRELFPDRMNTSIHRRQSAKALTPNEVANVMGRCQLYDGASESFTYSKPGRRPEGGIEREGDSGGGRDLFARINGGPQTQSSYGRLHETPSALDEDAGFSFKGAGRNNEEVGFSILGASRERAENPLVKELFPLKAASGNGGKDLFDGRIKGRGAQRRRAEDLF